MIQDKRRAGTARSAEFLFFFAGLDGNSDDFVSLVYPGKAVFYERFRENGVLAGVFPQGSARFGVKQNGLVRKTHEEFSFVMVLDDLQ